MIETLYCDMDGVLTDFTKAALNFHAISLDPLEVGWNFWEQANISAEAFWRPLGAAFWEHLPWTVEGRAVLANLREATGDDPNRLVLLTAPCETAGCADGKRAWVRRELGPDWAKRLIITNAKAALAAPCKLLIDDSDANCVAFSKPRRGKPGGHAIMVPRPWNRMRGLCNPDGSFDATRFNAEFNKQVRPHL